MLTTHGDAILDLIAKSSVHQKMFSMTPDDTERFREEYRREGFVYRSYAPDGIRCAKAGEDYGNSFTHETFIRSEWARSGLIVSEFIPGGLRGGQDIVILKKKA